ncbi:MULTISPECIES: 4-(cytidine 5'-diphospho)-2-C-methyl-D-erythritol kinase [Acidithiobacillus]|uniref:4-diphosphocytidyl-2-C-methyl-D-erythritol kinase n=3 Tax=Acidithiobacillus caldus TaxID=33059 RepID=F9ZSX6_ACICS|nr:MULTISPECIES: 4-(cytidine 5'-diphospho)-2-C-methyl-D-erythritol kinase [Acidithiobacillus]AEK57111.1 4-diphosphocytidyl-2-C-methyl-D-erythritol kinase [Acidithiobacillus caldus SM-1]AIA54374.1 4-diphosphocytidyl-2-C-methyl-D-erythritol kinase [Acidithiobacillus caldus ATCC 51756]AUW31889.1 4-(cytidine 5'-diphospho)-2-C-methyl-D-erythritol kinase [Acidithiobacillus caldus]MBU2728982.1 4-(cytidine 5'-diphospho)-2-C-methyl-D-erythritol kinase [Acidithiobacillus caldus]MBU2734757.1 4-(cytidine 
MSGDTFPAPAKINRMLRVVGRREDGYHLLQTVFQYLDLADTLQFRSLPAGQFRRFPKIAQVPEEQDLCLRAARLLAEETGCREGVAITLDKTLPMGGGLGGGSSDAATTLLVLNRLWGCGLKRPDLMELGLRLGADVPVFLFGRSAWAEGIGERLQALPELSEPRFFLIHPGVSVHTAAVFQHPRLTRRHPPITISAFLAEAPTNTLEALVRQLYPAVDECLRWMSAAGLHEPMLTGSGACCFGQLGGTVEPEALQAELPSGWRAWVVQGRNIHPLQHLVED